MKIAKLNLVVCVGPSADYGVHILLTNSPELKMVDLSGCDKLSASFMRKLRDTCECAMLFDADFGVAS